MTALLVALALFAFAWVLHLAWWRWQLPRHHSAALLLVFGSTPFLALGIWLVCGAPPLLSPWELPGVLAFHLGATGCYLITYAGVEQTSPSLVIIRALEAAGDRGCSEGELASLITEERFVAPRIAALRQDRLIAAMDGGFVLTRRGMRAAQAALLLSRVFNMREGS